MNNCQIDNVALSMMTDAETRVLVSEENARKFILSTRKYFKKAGRELSKSDPKTPTIDFDEFYRYLVCRSCVDPVNDELTRSHLESFTGNRANAKRMIKLIIESTDAAMDEDERAVQKLRR